MSAEAVKATTFRCDVANCDIMQVIAGETPSKTVTNVFGWSLGHTLFGIMFDACPTHTNELAEYVGHVITTENPQSLSDWIRDGSSKPFVPMADHHDDVSGFGMDLTEGGTR